MGMFETLAKASALSFIELSFIEKQSAIQYGDMDKKIKQLMSD